MLQQLAVKLDDRGNVSTDEDRMTSVSGIFAGAAPTRKPSRTEPMVARERRTGPRSA